MAFRGFKVVTAFATVMFFANGLSGPARAATYEVVFTGNVTSVEATLSGSFDTTQSLAGSYTFNSSVSANAGSDANFATFDALLGFNFSIGSYAASSSAAADIQIDNDPGFGDPDRYGVTSRASQGLTGADIDGLSLELFSFSLNDSTNAVFTDALQLPTALSLVDFDSTEFEVFFGSMSSFGSIRGSITGLSIALVPTPVPLPAALPLFAGGLGLMGLLGWRRKRTAAV